MSPPNASARMISVRAAGSIIGCGRPLGVLLFAEVQADMRADGRGQPEVRPERDVGVDRAERPGEHDLRLVTQGAAGEEPAYGVPCAGHPPGGLLDGSAQALRGAGHGVAEDLCHLPRPLFEGVGQERVPDPAVWSGHAEAGRDHRSGPAGADHGPGHVGVGGLGDQQDDLGTGIGVQRPHRFGGHQPAHAGRQVPAADADHLGHADAPPVQQGHHLLGTGPGRGDHSDRAGRDRVRETQAHPGRAPRCPRRGPSAASPAGERAP